MKKVIIIFIVIVLSGIANFAAYAQSVNPVPGQAHAINPDSLNVNADSRIEEMPVNDSTIVEKPDSLDIPVDTNSFDFKISAVDSFTDGYLDSLEIRKKTKINDYIMIGVQYGVGLSQMAWNPTRSQNMVFIPTNIGVTFTKYGKMFGYMPYFGFQVGLFYTQEGYQFKPSPDNGYTYKIYGAEKAVMDVIELPMLGHFHFDFWKMKIMANLGCYVGYRMKIERFAGETGNPESEEFLKYQHSFSETDIRFDYGIKGGLGFAFIFDPIEFHLQAMYKHSFSSLYQPDHYSKYYYRFAYPSNIIISVGVHFQLTKRTGKTYSELKKEARRLVYGK